MSTATLRLLTPELVLIIAAVAIYLGGAFCKTQAAWRWMAGLGLALAAGALAMQPAASGVSGPLSFDALAWQGRWMVLGFGTLLVLMASRPIASGGTSEYVGSLVLTIAGAMFTAAAHEIVLLFVGLELVSIPTYVTLFLGRKDAKNQEATAKYFFLSVLSSAVLLYGLSFYYGLTGSTELTSHWTAPAGFSPLARLAMVMIFAGLCFKIAAVPFHFYAADVYQGTTYPNAALLSVVPKAAGFLALLRLFVIGRPDFGVSTWQVVAMVAVLTMTLGNVLALWQDGLRRMLAYSSVANAGYMLIGLAVAMATSDGASGWSGEGALLFYLAAYAAATIGAFAALEYLGKSDRSLDGVDELAGLGRTRPFVAGSLALFMFSLTGVPPLAGFWGKLLVFGSAVSVGGPWFLALAVVGVLNAAVAAAYYLRIVAVMYFRAPLATPKAQGGLGPLLTTVVCAALVLAIGNVFGIWPR